MNIRSPVKPGAFNYLLDDIDRERRVRLDDLVHDNQPPPPRREPPRRVHIMIDLTQVTRKPRRMRYRAVGVLWTIIGLFLLLCAMQAHGQPVEWRSYREGFLTRMQGTDSRGGNWTGTSYQQGHLTITDANGPNGQVVHCTAQMEGFAMVTRCDP